MTKSFHKVGLLATCHSVMQSGLIDAGYELLDLQNTSRDTILNNLEDLYGIVISTKISIDSAFLERARHLRWIARLGSGLDHINIQGALEKRIVILTSPEGNAPSVAEHCLGLLLNASRNITASFLDVKNRKWQRELHRGRLIHSMCVGIIGYGHMGSAFAGLLHRLGVRVLIYDKYKTSFPLLDNQQRVSLEVLQSECDAISIHIPLNKDNFYYIDDQFFYQLKRSPIIINTSRGGVLDTNALLDALEKGYIGYACLDVLENESLHSLGNEERRQFEALIRHPHVLITPHIAGVTQESFKNLSQVLLEKILHTDSAKV